MSSIQYDQRTLREALQDFHQKHHVQLSHEDPAYSEAEKQFFHCHDIAHVIFDCDTSLLGEGSVKIWTLFGTTLSFLDHLKGYRSVGAFQLAKNFSFKEIVGQLGRLLYRIGFIIYRSKRMTVPWPWRAHEKYLDRPLGEIRKELNIQVF